MIGPMAIYLKSIGVGVMGAVLAVVAWVAIQVLFVAIAVAWQARGGSGGVGAVSSGIPLIVAIAGFVGGFLWRYRRGA